MRAENKRYLSAVPRVLFMVSLSFGMIFVSFLFSGCPGSPSVLTNGYEPGIYEGTGQGYRGPVHVQVQVARAGIEDIVITGHSDSSYPGAAAMEELLEQVLEYGSTDLDVIAGASFSSRGFLDAVEDAVAQAIAQNSSD